MDLAVLLLLLPLSSALAYRTRQATVQASPYCLSLFDNNVFHSIFDRNSDGKVSVSELITSPSDIVLTHSSLARNFITSWKRFFRTITSSRNINWLLSDLGSIMSPFDFCVILLLIVTHKQLLRAAFRLTHRYRYFSKLEDSKYKRSLIGSLENAVTLLVWYPPALVLIDASTVVLRRLTIPFNTKKDMPSLFSMAYSAVTIGVLITKIKDWVAYKMRLRKYKLCPRLEARDREREAVTDEMSSLLCWFFITIFCLQAMSLELGIALGSIFALGGIGSASVVLALRGTMENLVGGVLLKLQDKLRVGEKISVPGTNEEGEVEEISYLQTRLRRDDDSIIAIPNAQFIQGEVVNWSRTPYRLFKTSLKLPEDALSLLPTVVTKLQDELTQMEGVEAKERDLIVAATGFIQGRIKLQVEVRVCAGNDVETAAVITRVVDKIASVIDQIYSEKITTQK